jgi:16S rRNA (cytidine1402-2'-O)-methyltransferase
MKKGTLYIVPTPIGNLSDITLRALEVLKEVELILSEDTRDTTKLLDRYGITKSQISYRDQNHERVFERLFELLDTGADIALVSDSGTPLISDPGFKLVRDLIAKEIPVVALPGASAVTSALVVSGFPTDKFTFLGFLPKSGGQRKKLLMEYGGLDSTLIIYESPFRINKLLEEIKESLDERKVCLVNDQTKLYEKVIRGTVSELLENTKSAKLKGEFVVLVAKKDF